MQRFFKAADRLMASDRTMKSIYETSKAFSSEVAVEYFHDGRTDRFTYREYFYKTAQTASKLEALLHGIPKDSVIVLKYKNAPDWGCFFWAILMCGYRPLLVDAKADLAAAEKLIMHSKAGAVITEDSRAYSVLSLSPAKIQEVSGKQDFMPVWANHVLFCSSGTTGEAKVIVFDGECFCHQINSARRIPEESLDVMYPSSIGRLKNLALLPFHHVFGFVAVFLWYSFFGRTIVYLDELTPERIFLACRRLRVTHVYAVPLVWDRIAQGILRSAKIQGEAREKLLQKIIAFHTGKISRAEAGAGASVLLLKQIQKKLLGTHIRYCISGGGYLSVQTLKVINGIGFPLYNGYGMTEIGVSGVELTADVKKRLEGSIGHPFHGFFYKIKPEPDSSGSNQGELLIRSGTVFIGQMRDGKFTPREKGAWFPTGDFVLRRDESYWIKSRIKDVIINPDGENVFPDELENHFSSLPCVEKCCVLGMPEKNTLKERIVLVLEPLKSLNDHEKALLSQEIQQKNQRLPLYKRVQIVCIAPNALPVNNIMKIQKYLVREDMEKNLRQYEKLLISETDNSGCLSEFPPELVENLFKRIRGIFSGLLAIRSEELFDDGHFIYDFGGDSLLYADLVLRLEEEFKIQIPESSYGFCFTIRGFAVLLAERLR